MSLNYKELPIGTVIKVYTKNSIYTFEKVEEDEHMFDLVASGGYFEKNEKDGTRCYIDGSSGKGIFLKRDTIEIGMILELMTIWNIENGTYMHTSTIKMFEVMRRYCGLDVQEEDGK